MDTLTSITLQPWINSGIGIARCEEAGTQGGKEERGKEDLFNHILYNVPMCENNEND